MFDNIGSKIKSLAQVVCWLEIIASVIVGSIFVAQDEDTILSGILILILGPLFAWISSFFMYGFGQLIENTDVLVEQGKKEVSSQKNTRENKILTLQKWRNQGIITHEEYLKKLESLKHEKN